MKVLVVGEEKRIIRKLERALRSMDDSLRIIGTVPSLFTTAEWLQQYGIPDIILVSQEVMGERQFPKLHPSEFNATVIFTLQSDQFAFQAFRINHLEHLFPTAALNSLEAIDPASTKPSYPVVLEPPAKPALYRNRFLVKQGQKFASVEIEVIAYFFSEGRFIFFKTYDGQKYLVEYTLEELESMLNPQDFFRINRSLLIAFKSVSQIHPYFGNRLKLYLDPPMEKEIIVSREKVNDFKLWLGQ